MWILSKMRFSNCEFLDKSRIFAPVWKAKRVLYLWSIELDPGLSFDQCGWQLHYNGLDSVGWGPSLGRHELHAQCSTVKDVSAVENWMDHSDKGRVEREGILEGEGEQNVIFSLFLLQFLEILGQRGVWVYPHDLDVPLVERVVDQLHLVGAGFEWRTSVDIAQFFHQSVGGLYRSGHSALKRYTFKNGLAHWGKKSTFYPKIHTLKIPIFTKFTFLKSHFSQNSHFQSLIFHKNSHFSNIKFLVISG